MSIKISIIVPVYACKSSIEGTLRSVSEQSMKEIEVIMVDDHSEDGSAEAAEEAASRLLSDIPWRMLHTPVNSGPGVARNLGIEAAAGEYVAFLDADDRLDCSFCEKMYQAASGKDIACCDIRFIWPDGRMKVKKNPRTENRKRYLRRFVSYFTTYIYRREVLLREDVRFPASRSAEDSCFLICALMVCGSMGRVCEPLYDYYRSSGSLSGSSNRSRADWRMRSYNYLLRFVRSHGLYDYLPIVMILYVKKGVLLSLKDILRG